MGAWRRWLACKMAPELQDARERHQFLLSEISDAHRWLGEFADAETVLQWLMERDADHWRKLGEPALGALPCQISQLRELMRRRAAEPTED